MKRHAISLTVLAVAIFLLPASGFGQDSTPALTGAGEATLPGGSIFNGIPLTGLTFSAGVFIPGDGSANGGFQVTLLGTGLLGLPVEIEITVEAATGSIDGGTATVSGPATIEMIGVPLLTDVPFTLTVTQNALVLDIDSTSLAAANLTSGGITIE
jgi:hypothetical protein